MNVTVNVICYKSKTLSNGEHPIVLRISKNGKRKYISIGVSVNPIYWDFVKNTPKANCPNKDYIKKIILDKETEYQKQILEFKSNQKEFTVSTLANSIERSPKASTVGEFYVELIAGFKAQCKVGNANIYRDSHNSLISFTKSSKLDFLFTDIDSFWLNRYEKWLLNKNCAPTTMSLLFRTLRSVFNKAIEQGIVKLDSYPFNSFKISKFNTKTKKRAITKDEIKRIIELDLSKERELIQLSRDLFIFSYLQGGINLTDIAHLKYENIASGRLEYLRQKTKGLINIPLQDEALRIIQKYSNSDANSNDYIFPILNRKIHITAIQKYNRIHKIIGKINPNLKLIAQKANIEANLTTYVARHSFATVLKRSGVNTSIISESLGHSSEKVTQIYLDSFENSQIDEAMKNLL